MSKPTSDRGIAVGGSVSNSALNTGDGNQISVVTTLAPQSPAVDIGQLLQLIEARLARLESPDRQKIDHAMAEAQAEAGKPSADRDEIGKALGRALDYAKKTSGFVAALEELKPPLLDAARWLGSHGHLILRSLGLG